MIIPSETTKVELERLVRETAEMHRDELARNDFTPQFLWFDTAKQLPRLLMFPDMSKPDRDLIAWALTVLSATVEADKLIFINETFHTKSPTKHDGSKWGPGEMQEAFYNKTADADLVVENLSYMIADTSGWCAMASLQYIRKDDGTIEFGELQMLIEGETPDTYMGGAFPEMMREAVVAPKLMDEIRKTELPPAIAALGLTEGQQAMHTICAGVKIVMGRAKFACLIPAHTEEENEVLTSSLGHLPGAYTPEDIAEIADLEENFKL